MALTTPVPADDEGKIREVDGIQYVLQPGDRFELTIESQFPRDNMTTVEALPVAIALKNVSEKTQQLFSHRWDLYVKVLGPDGKPVRNTLFGEKLRQPSAGSQFGKQLPSGDTMRSRCYLNEAHDLSLPGKYQIWVEWNYLAGFKYLGGPALIEAYKSNVIEFQLHRPRMSVDHSPEPAPPQ